MKRYEINLQFYTILRYAMKKLYESIMKWFAALYNDAKF